MSKSWGNLPLISRLPTLVDKEDLSDPGVTAAVQQNKHSFWTMRWWSCKFQLQFSPRNSLHICSRRMINMSQLSTTIALSHAHSFVVPDCTVHWPMIWQLRCPIVFTLVCKKVMYTVLALARRQTTRILMGQTSEWFISHSAKDFRGWAPITTPSPPPPPCQEKASRDGKEPQQPLNHSELQGCPNAHVFASLSDDPERTVFL